jgi:hypothetical protein
MNGPERSGAIASSDAACGSNTTPPPCRTKAMILFAYGDADPSSAITAE